ncbi:unnamed protein product [Paramecium sonneborni]|uniref:Transmembrane protein n=1 Tax=Paramecium sonneborni TaxID=65129 RepID=A0A8S1QJC9_9CILI|nr:unnamed protein product [Paramecium sonneborni]
MIQLSTEKIDELSQSNQGKFIIEMVQTHTEMRGSLGMTELYNFDDLVTAIGDFWKTISQGTFSDLIKLRYQSWLDRKLIFLIKKTLLMLIYYLILIKKIKKIERLNEILDKINIKNIQTEEYTKQLLLSKHQSANSAVDEALQLINSKINANIVFSEKAPIYQAIKRVNNKIQKISIIHPLVEAFALINIEFFWLMCIYEKTLMNNSSNKFGRQNKKLQILNIKNLSILFQKLHMSWLFIKIFIFRQIENKDAQAQEIKIYNLFKAQYQIQLQTTRNSKEFVNSAEFSTVIRNKQNSGGLV